MNKEELKLKIKEKRKELLKLEAAYKRYYECPYCEDTGKESKSFISMGYITNHYSFFCECEIGQLASKEKYK